MSIYSDKQITLNSFTRTFKHNVNDHELVWHRDRANRFLTVLSGNQWYLQMDNQLPVALTIGSHHYIPQEIYHRLIKGTDDLVVKIEES